MEQEIVRDIAKKLSKKFDKREIFIMEMIKYTLSLGYSLKKIEDVIIDFFI